ncbi:pentapeptide repeat-containing protein [Streptomyces sp. NPDC002787]
MLTFGYILHFQRCGCYVRLSEPAVLVGMESKRSRLPRLIRWGLVAVAAVGVPVLFTVVLWQVPWWLDDHYLNEDLSPAQGTTVSGMRTALTALGAGLLVAAGLGYTHHTLQQTRARDREQAELTREGQVTDRFSRAIGQIASAKAVEQLGGIYSLERIMRDSAKDHATIVEVLAAFIREHAPAPDRGKSRAVPAHRRLWRKVLTRVPKRLRRYVSMRLLGFLRPKPEASVRPRPSEPVQAALSVLVRRPQDRDEPFRLDLRRTDLRNAQLNGAHLERADLFEARMQGARLAGAHLEKANLCHVDLGIAVLEGAHLQGALLRYSQLGLTNLRGANLEGTWGLTVEQLVGAQLSEDTKLPASLAEDPEALARLAALKEARLRAFRTVADTAHDRHGQSRRA